MKYIEVRTDWSKKLSALGTLGVVALAPLFAAPDTVQAQPPAHAPAHGYYKNKGKGKKNKQDKHEKWHERHDRDDDDDYDDDDAGYDGNRDNRPGRPRRPGNVGNITLNGTVTRDLRGGDRFQVRADNGRVYEVVSHNREPLRLSRGDRVQLAGHIDRNLFIAHSVRILNNVGGGSNGGFNRRALSGTVTRDLRGDRFEIRADNGRTYQVRARNDEPIRLTPGDRVTLRGDFDRSGVFNADSVRITRNDDRNRNGSRVDFPGTVISIESSTRFVVRADNGRTYLVQSDEAVPSRLSVGDRVRVRGRAEGGTVSADRVRLERDRDGSQSGQSVDFRGRVTRVNAVLGVLTVQGNNDRTYSVRASNAGDFERGDRVRVVGSTQRGGIVIASSITRL